MGADGAKKEPAKAPADADGAKAAPTPKAAPAPKPPPPPRRRRKRRLKKAHIGFGALLVPDRAEAEQLHCSGKRLPSPMGGHLTDLGVRDEPDGGSTVLFECPRSALRYELPQRTSSWRERKKVREQAVEGGDPVCPRGEPGPALVRRGIHFYCPRCSVMFGRAP